MLAMNAEKEMFFFIADISGYTNYMLINQMEMQHGKLSITFLIHSLVKYIDLPLEISKLEGDAIFMYQMFLMRSCRRICRDSRNFSG